MLSFGGVNPYEIGRYPRSPGNFPWSKGGQAAPPEMLLLSKSNDRGRYEKLKAAWRRGNNWCGGTWRIIPFSRWLVTPIYKPFRPFGRGIGRTKPCDLFGGTIWSQGFYVFSYLMRSDKEHQNPQNHRVGQFSKCSSVYSGKISNLTTTFQCRTRQDRQFKIRGESKKILDSRPLKHTPYIYYTQI